ncbi:MAG TPA: DUF305 domain-containing protein [Bellilinea sp.]|nr:DUF305 domain-containing protein [Bellilinea sp.]
MEHKEMNSTHNKHNMYLRLGIMSLLSFIAMYLVMFSMIDKWDSFFNNINMAYMAGLMVAPMILFEIVLMWAMYPDKKRNYAIAVGAVVLGILMYIFIRQQTLVEDKQFLRSMIPHHAGAVLMCEKATLSDPEIKALCTDIIASQQQEIDQMKMLLDRLE